VGLELKWMHLRPWLGGMSMINRIRLDHIKLKQAYEPPAPDDGTQILIDRLWPRRIELSARDGSLDESHSDGFGLRKNHL
jgi:uncharacterized protein DUF488